MVAELHSKRDNKLMTSQNQEPEIFLDNNATTRPLPMVQQAMLFAMREGFGNASSAHRGGEAARKLVARSRVCVAELVGADAGQIVFTSGATESNNWSVFSGLVQPEIERLATTQTEHSSIMELVDTNFDVAAKSIKLPVDSNGVIVLSCLAEICAERPALVSTHWVNNETGVVQPVNEIAKICAEFNCLFHVDASQAVGKVSIQFADSGIHFLTIAAHKFHGPQGIGALCCFDVKMLKPFLYGGGQERNMRPGTENLPGIAGFGKAAELRRKNFGQVTSELNKIRVQFERLVFEAIPNVYINGGNADRVCNTSNLRFDGVDGQALVAQLDIECVRCSQSSACTAQIPESSYVLRAMGLSEEEAYSSVRFSFSELNTFEEIGKAVEVLTRRVRLLRDFQGSLTSR